MRRAALRLVDVWVFALTLFLPVGALAAPRELSGSWVRVPEGRELGASAEANAEPWRRVTGPERTGGHYVCSAEFWIEVADSYVIDFKNSSTIGEFRHVVFDAAGVELVTLEGGIQSTAENPFLLRHGRSVALSAGHYKLVSSVRSPFFLGQPTPFIDTEAHYRRAIKQGNVLVLVCLGIFLGLGSYYAALALMQRRLADGMYALFILGNLLYNGSALLVYPDVFGMHWFYLISVPILFSNLAYVGFVIALLDLRHTHHPLLLRAGLWLCVLLLSFVVLSAIRPNWSLELDRYGVGMFVSYGVVASTIRAREGCPIARAYLVAVAALFVLSMVAISLNGLQTYTFYIEHVGLVAVSVEVMLLALVLARRPAEQASIRLTAAQPA